eukprot:1892765-Alexandrium_andersonii.AAC.1
MCSPPPARRLMLRRVFVASELRAGDVRDAKICASPAATPRFRIRFSRYSELSGPSQRAPASQCA